MPNAIDNQRIIDGFVVLGLSTDEDRKKYLFKYDEYRELLLHPSKSITSESVASEESEGDDAELE